MSDKRSRWRARLGGGVVGIAVFVAANVSMGRAIVPSVASVGRIDAAYQPSPPEPPKPPYQAVCSACHQPDGQGIPFAFPPLAGSQWMTGDPETPIRIALLGLSGRVQVNGTTFDLVMPAPGLDDAKIAEAITYARTSFGNRASAVDTGLVKKVRESLRGRNHPWTATELVALRAGAAGSKDVANADATGTGATRDDTMAGKKSARARARTGRLDSAPR